MKTKTIGLLLLTIVFSTAAFAQINLTQGLIMYLPFTGNATDASGNTNVVTVSGPVLVADRNGNANSAYSFDGVNDFMSIALGTGMKPQYPFSFSCWIKLNTIGNGVNLMFSNDYVIPGSSYYGGIFNLPTGLLLGNVGDGGAPGPSSRKTKQSTQPIPVGSWHHVAVIVNSAANMRLFLDCAEIQGSYTGNGAGLVYSNGQGMIGRGNGGFGENYINANLDEMRFYNRALNDQEIVALYTYPNPPGTPVTLGNNIQYLCPNGSLTLTPQPSGLTIDQWSDGSTGPDLTVNCPGEYWVAVTDACGITTYDTVDVQMAPAIQEVNLGPDVVACPGDVVTLNGQVNNATSYLWSNNSIQQQISVTTGGNYWVQVANQCYSSRDTVNVSYTSPAINLTTTGSSPICYGDTATLTVTAPLTGATLVWSNGDVGTQATIYGPGIYWVKAIDNCTLVVDTILVNLDKGCPDTTVSLIEHFNGEAKFLKDYYVNDAWVITNLPQHNSVIVYDATGRLVFNTSNYQNNWRPETTNGIYYYQLYSNQNLVTNGRLLIVK